MIRKWADLKSLGYQPEKSATRDHADTLLRGMSDSDTLYRTVRGLTGRCWNTKGKFRVGTQCGHDHACWSREMPRIGSRSIAQHH